MSEPSVDAAAADLLPPDDSYKAPEKKSIEELIKLDAEDESLRRYKENLLGGVGDKSIPFPSDKRHLIMKSLKVIIKDGPTKELDLSGDLENLRDNPIEIPEGSHYYVEVVFFVQREIIAGLRYLQSAYWKTMKVDVDNVMLGSYPPRLEPIVWRSEEEEAPSGKLSRGVYNMTSKFIDDDKTEHIKFKWAIKIVKTD